METHPFKRAVVGYGTVLALEARGVTRRPVRRLADWLTAHRTDVAVAFVLWVLCVQLYFWTGRHFMATGVMYLDDGIFGWDVQRSVEDMLTAGSNRRSNVHPFFVLYAKPYALIFSRLLGLTKHTSALAVSSVTTGFAVVAAYAFFRAWGTAIFESAIFAAIYGAGFTTYMCGAAPETRAFSNLNIVTLHLLACVGIVHRRESQFLWWIAAVFTYGTTISNILKIPFAYVATHWGRLPRHELAVRVVAFLVTVGVACQLLTSLAGSSRDVMLDKWMTTEETRGGRLDDIPIRMARNFFLYSVVAPTPQYAEFFFHGVNHQVANFLNSSYKPLPKLLAWIWAGMLAAGLAAAAIRRRPEHLRMLACIGLCLAFDFGLFSVYYVAFEGFFVWSPHVSFTCFAITVFAAAEISRLPVKARYAARGALCIFLALVVVNSVQVALLTARLFQG